MCIRDSFSSGFKPVTLSVSIRVSNSPADKPEFKESHFLFKLNKPKQALAKNSIVFTIGFMAFLTASNIVVNFNAADLNGEIVGDEMLNNRIYSDMKMLDNFSKKWSIAGKSEIIDINKKLGCSIPEGADYHTLAGFLLEKFQMVPKIGDVLDFSNIKFEVISMSGPKIDRVKIILPKI